MRSTAGPALPDMGPDAAPPDPHSLPVDVVAERLRVDPHAGLSEEEAERRLRRFGPNLLAARRPVSDLALILRQFASTVVALLAAAMALSLLFGEWQQAAAIAAVLVINAAIGFFTERQAIRSMEALRRLGARSARVRRHGHSRRLPAEQLVPGDVVLLEAGDVVPADMRCSEAAGLRIDESALTGESSPVEKGIAPNVVEAPLPDRSAMLFKGSHVVHGGGEGVVTGTGLATEVGRITQLVETAERGETPLERQLALLSRQLVWLMLALAAVITVVGIASGRPAVLMVETSIALAVAAIPEGLPIVAALALARGMLRMARRNALVENLPAVETLGSTTLVMTDKTGTLTENRMEVERILTPSGEFSVDHRRAVILKDGATIDPVADPQLVKALLVGVLCSNAEYDSHARSGTGDPMEVALLRAGGIAGLNRDEQISAFPEVAEHPFDTATKRMATVHRSGNGHFAAVKGAPEEVLASADRIGIRADPLDDAGRARWLRQVDRLAAEGLRVLAVAVLPETGPEARVSGGLVFLGLVAFRDPPRHDIPDAVAALRGAGIRVVMATGDHPSTALGISRAVGIAEEGAAVTRGAELPCLEGATAAERRAVSRGAVFARVSPEQKLELIDLFQESGEVVAMIGDGVNDAPALTKADIGIAMGERGTEVAREAADMVLLDDAFSTIVQAVREGRIIFDNIRRFSTYLLSCNLAEVLVVGGAVFVGLPLPLMPLQILFLNLVTDVFPAFALAAGEGEGDVLARPPRPPKEAILTPTQWRIMAVYGAAIAASALFALVMAARWLGLAAGETTTVSFLTVALAQLWHVFNMRSRGTGPWRNAVIGNRFVWWALALCLALILAAVHVPVLAAALQLAPIGAQGWALAVGCSLLPLVGAHFWLGRTGRALPRWGAGARELARE
ncbi:cation-transporting P-type ATPase [Chelatococcus sp. SYSU_G07232]|uniref:Cation-transporting P-type ATPase n=1 Tax=Chelatococcus albus TaxID=3047466 RepID=A0ABT7AB84_9HYPH|nr:cation-transporting P-type ATPase [Chelatococcus sp. SYSU_G07232]MDJ1156645.1 cation-transporting P-type ATPase [Chelatococcus sp. SYSU_G07232]